MNERYEQREQVLRAEDRIAHTLEALLRERTGEVFELEEYHGTYEIESDTFSLTFTIEEDLFEIRFIEARGIAGRGSKIVEAIHEIADAEDMTVYASNVLDTAIEFWKKMGYVEGSEEGEYFRVR